MQNKSLLQVKFEILTGLDKFILKNTAYKATWILLPPTQSPGLSGIVTWAARKLSFNSLCHSSFRLGFLQNWSPRSHVFIALICDCPRADPVWPSNGEISAMCKFGRIALQWDSAAIIGTAYSVTLRPSENHAFALGGSGISETVRVLLCGLWRTTSSATFREGYLITLWKKHGFSSII